MPTRRFEEAFVLFVVHTRWFLRAFVVPAPLRRSPLLSLLHPATKLAARASSPFLRPRSRSLSAAFARHHHPNPLALLNEKTGVRLALRERDAGEGEDYYKYGETRRENELRVMLAGELRECGTRGKGS